MTYSIETLGIRTESTDRPAARLCVYRFPFWRGSGSDDAQENPDVSMEDQTKDPTLSTHCQENRTVTRLPHDWFLQSLLHLKYAELKSALQVGKLILNLSKGNFNIEKRWGWRGERFSSSRLLTDDGIYPLLIRQGETSLLGVTAVVQDTAHKAVLSGQSGGLGQRDAPLQSLAVTRVWQGCPVYLHGFARAPLSVHGRRLQARAAVVEVDWLAASVDAAVGLLFPLPLVPQVEDMPPGRVETFTTLPLWCLWNSHDWWPLD